MKPWTLFLILGLLPVLAVGCSRRVVEAENPALLRTDQYEAYFDSAMQVLRDHGFVIDRHDYRFGVITTRPLGSPTVLEPWHAQNTTAAQAWESTFADEQRIVTVKFSESGANKTGSDPVSGGVSGGGPFAIAIEVMLERKQVPTRRLTGSATRNVFDALAAAPRELADKGVTGNYWEPVGRDAYLEARLMKQVRERVGVAE